MPGGVPNFCTELGALTGEALTLLGEIAAIFLCHSASIEWPLYCTAIQPTRRRSDAPSLGSGNWKGEPRWQNSSCILVASVVQRIPGRSKQLIAWMNGRKVQESARPASSNFSEWELATREWSAERQIPIQPQTSSRSFERSEVWLDVYLGA